MKCSALTETPKKVFDEAGLAALKTRNGRGAASVCYEPFSRALSLQLMWASY
jgi:hypothetical protein